MTGHQEPWTSQSSAQARSAPGSEVTAPPALGTAAQWNSMIWHNTRGSEPRAVRADAAPRAPQTVTAGR
jgi:hypothetical protein